MKLYHFAPSPNSRRVLATIYHLRLEVELHTVNLARGEQLQRDFLRLNPNHMIPTLVDDDFILWESVPIMQYLCNKTGNKTATSLWPAEPRMQADVSRWLCWNIAHWNATCGIFIFERLVKPAIGQGETETGEIAKAEERFQRFASVLEHHLKHHDWLSGGQLTLADFAVASPLALSESAGYPLTGYSHIHKWYERIAGLPAWRQSDPANFGDGTFS